MVTFPKIKPFKEISENSSTFPTPKPNRRYLTFASGSTVVTSASSYKTKISNRFHSIEATDVKVRDRGEEPTYYTMAMLLVALQRLAKTEDVCPAICTYTEGQEVELPSKMSEFIKVIDDTPHMYLKVKIGKKNTPFCFSITKGDDRIHVTTRIYHPLNLSSQNVLTLLQHKINEELKCIDIILLRLHKIYKV